MDDPNEGTADAYKDAETTADEADVDAEEIEQEDEAGEDEQSPDAND